MCQHARMGDTMIQEAAPWKSESRWFQPFASPMQLQLWPRSFGSLGNTRMLTLPPSLRSWWWQTFRKWLVWRSSGVRAVFEWGPLNGFREVFTQWKSMKRTIILYYFCWCVEFPKGLVHTPIQIPSKNDVLTMISSPLGYKIPQLSPTGSLINLPRLGCTILRLKKASCRLVGQASQASLLQPRHLQMVSQMQQNSASSADDHRLMIMGYFIAKTHPLPKKVLQVAPKKNVMLAVLCHLWEATVLRNLWGTTQASATWLKPRRSALRVT